MAVLLLLCLPLTMTAQRRKTVRKPKVVAPVENPVFTKMLQATAQVLIADSLVTDSASLLKAVPVNPEEGRLATFSEVFGKKGTGIVYTNELGNKRIFSQMVETGRKRLFQTDLIGDTWTEPAELVGIDEDGELTDFDYPYLMPDGVTLYFAARGGEGLGGFDIYRTRFDAENSRFLKPENLGLPFNSEADDYMYVIDEQHQLAYFASARRQPKDTLCVYTFVPFETRTVLTPEAYTPEQLRSMARINRIADTWGNGTERKKALRRRQLAQPKPLQQKAEDEFVFIVNDQRTYTRMADFRLRDNRDRMSELLSMQKQLEVLETALTKARNYYATASARERKELTGEILNSERQKEQLQRDIQMIEKLIRNTENQ